MSMQLGKLYQVKLKELTTPGWAINISQAMWVPKGDIDVLIKANRGSSYAHLHVDDIFMCLGIKQGIDDDYGRHFVYLLYQEKFWFCPSSIEILDKYYEFVRLL